MPKTPDNVGYSECTFGKQEGLGAVLGQHIEIVKRVLNNHPYFPQQYYYIDLYAGSGSNQDGLEGSPVIFLKKILASHLKYNAWFIEQEPGNIRTLHQAVSFANSHEVVEGDNRQAFPLILNRIPQNAFGFVYADPNGMPDFLLLALAAAKRKKLDLLIRYNAAAAKRNGQSLEEHLAIIGKSYWLIQEPDGKWQWSFLIGTNYEIKPWRKYGFHSLREEKGREIFERLAYTRGERAQLNQPALFDNSARQIALERSGGICERCGKNPVDQIHHKSYNPPVEVPENMLAVCFACHCEIHGKEN